MKKDDCIFCKLAGGDIPTNTIYEDDSFRAILDNGPATRGHTLIIPKDHSEDLFSCDGVNLVQNNGTAAGQTVMHFHLHVIPRYTNDGQHILWKPTEPSTEELRQVREELAF